MLGGLGVGWFLTWSQFNCCGYTNSTTTPFFETDATCTSPAVAASLGGCVGPFSTFGNNYLDLIFTGAFGVVGMSNPERWNQLRNSKTRKRRLTGFRDWCGPSCHDSNPAQGPQGKGTLSPHRSKEQRGGNLDHFDKREWIMSKTSIGRIIDEVVFFPVPIVFMFILVRILARLVYE